MPTPTPTYVTSGHPGELRGAAFFVWEAVHELKRATLPQVAARLRQAGVETRMGPNPPNHFRLARWYLWRLEKDGLVRKLEKAAPAEHAQPRAAAGAA